MRATRPANATFGQEWNRLVAVHADDTTLRGHHARFGDTVRDS